MRCLLEQQVVPINQWIYIAIIGQRGGQDYYLSHSFIPIQDTQPGQQVASPMVITLKK